MDGLDRRERRRWILPVVSAGAAAVLATAITALLLAPRRPDERELAAFAVQFHDGRRAGGETLCLRCEDDPASACRKYFGDRAATEACLRQLPGFAWRAAALVPVREKLICWTVQECSHGSGNLISHADLPSDAFRAADGEGVHRYEIGGRIAILIRRGDRTCLFVTDSAQSADRLLELIQLPSH
jgi:hypothetical protein